ncbi:MAG: amidohydrolase family protein [Bacteroidales bacterium]|jgi:cytosine/adenosine deaminase-related metal-dependent hydrolase|nr:amidohydrolase family protein [Bacteroidales bacterium]
MIYRADYIFPIDGKPIKNGYLEVDDEGTILSYGSGESVGTKSILPAEYLEGILVPGFANAHCHVELSHMKGLFRQGTGMDGFIQQINALRLTVSQEERIAALTEQMEQMYAEGVSVMADISNCDESFECKASSPIYTRTYLEVFGTEPEDAPQILAGAIKLQEKAERMGLDAAPTPHSPYTMSPLLNRLSAAEGLKSGYISYHNQESDQEEDMIRYGTGELAEDYKARGCSMPPVTGESALKYFLDNLQKEVKAPIEGRVLLVHNTVTDQKSIDEALKVLKNPYWAVCPLSNIFIHRILPPLELLMANNLTICVGTDSLSSNLQLSMVEEIRCIQGHFPHIPLEEILKWCCLNGACAVGVEERFGSFTPGKRPGIVLIDNVDYEKMVLTKESRSRRII